jgi:rhomboid protease GluP
MGDQKGSDQASRSETNRAWTVVPGANRGRIAPADLLAFRRALDGVTCRSVVTPLLVLACGGWFAAMTAAGIPMLWPRAAQLVGWGANDGARVILRHEFWRLAASVFVHGGVIHLVVNMWSLLMIGPLVERIFGHLAFAVLYLASGIGGAIASAAVPPLRVSVGASGAICGVLGALLAFLVVHRRVIPPTVFRQFSRNGVVVVVLMAVFGALFRIIDQAAHVGGLAVGFASGLLLIGPWPVAPRRRRLLARRAAVSGAIALALAGAAVAVARHGQSAMPPDRRLNDLTEQLEPIVVEFDAIRRDLARSVGRIDTAEDSLGPPASRPVLREIRARAAVNERRIRGVRVSDPELRPIRDALGRALAGQVERLDSLDRYLETGDRTFLEAARDALARTVGGLNDCEAERSRYMARHGLKTQ